MYQKVILFIQFSEAQTVYVSQTVCARNRVLGDWCDKVLLAELDLLVGLGWSVGGGFVAQLSFTGYSTPLSLWITILQCPNHL